MNMHVSQSTVTAVELLELASVNTQIISPRECKPIISVVQDIALGIFRISKSNVYISDKQMMNLMATNPKFDGIMPKPAIDNGSIQKWTGRQAMSTIIPKNITLKRPNKNFDDKRGADKENYVIIENGELLQGTLDKTIYQDRTKGLIHSIVNECGNDEARLFFDNTQKIICSWLRSAGFSTGISDLIIDNETIVNLKKTIRDMKVKVYDMIKTIHTGQFENKSINSNNEYFEDEVNSMLNTTRDIVGKMALAKIDDNLNRMINMVKSGSKGAIINVSQMIACLGQQNVDGKRIAYGFDDRTLPHYVKFDDGPESHGFVENSFITGLSPQEFFYHAMGGREGLIDTAVKSVTGDTAIIVIENGLSKRVNIGDWIDSHLDKEKDKIKHFPEDRNMEFLELKEKVYIPTADNEGNTSWGELTAVTRHDPGERLYEVTTLGGRKVTVAESKSLIVWNKKKKEFIPTESIDIKIGDCVPATVYLSKPPIIKEYFDMVEYFPKNEYIWGTDFNKAVKLSKEAQGNNFHIPQGWWGKNNGSTFTLPYTKKASLSRATSGRSNTDNIFDGCIYPYKAMRERAIIPDKFDLTFENGAFIGIFLADGNTDTPAGSIQISKEDSTVQQFVRDWFDKYNITHRTVSQQKEIGISYGVIGSSTLLCRFLDKFVGIGAINKYVPDIAYMAPDDFVKGIISGYFSGDGSIYSKDNYAGGITAGSSSKKLIEGISMLCFRFGIFGKISIKQAKSNNLGTENIAPSYTLSIRAQFAKKFSEEINLIMDSKNIKMKNSKYSDSHINFEEHNDIVLDKIVDIKILGVEKYPKLYDVTVPSTLNFTGADGIIRRDTSETGYIDWVLKSRRDVKN